jgi:hypothetical protein
MVRVKFAASGTIKEDSSFPAQDGNQTSEPWSRSLGRETFLDFPAPARYQKSIAF